LKYKIFVEQYLNSSPSYKFNGSGLLTLTGNILGICFGVGLCLAYYSNVYYSFGLAIAALSYFHLWEFTFVSIFHYNELNFDSFLINHSPQYHIAMVTWIIEYFTLNYFLPNYRNYRFFIYLGLLGVIVGLTFRTFSMYTAGYNFHHQVQTEKDAKHILVKNGVYGLFRHPSYFGWFVYTVSLQVMVCNPVSTFAFGFVAWKFFENRIQHEEEALIDMFKEDYIEYKTKVPSGIPFIK